jgi:ammonium transporter Rh
LIGIEILIIIFYAIYVHVDTDQPTQPLANVRYPAFQDVNVMMLIGFGFLMTFIKTHALSALSYTFFINAIVIQLYMLFNPLWDRIINGNPNGDYFIELNQIMITKGSYCVAAILISFGGVIGKVGPKELLIMGIIEVIGYCFNEVFVSDTIGALDVGGSMLIHSFGAYFGLTVSWILSNKITPVTRATANYNSFIFGLIGTLFLWMFWPSFNFGAGAENFYDQNQIVINTLFSLTGSCLSTFAVSALFGHGFVMDDILNATLAGGVAIGASSGVLYQPSAAIAIGFVAGVISTLGFHYLTPKLETLIGLYDTCGINNLHGIPGVFGGLVSAVVIAGYNSSFTQENASQYGPSGLFPKILGTGHTFGKGSAAGPEGAFLHQAWLQVLGTLFSVAFAIICGVVAGQIISCFYKEKKENFFEDREYFDQVLFEEEAKDEHKLA